MTEVRGLTDLHAITLNYANHGTADAHGKHLTRPEFHDQMATQVDYVKSRSRGHSLRFRWRIWKAGRSDRDYHKRLRLGAPEMMWKTGWSDFAISNAIRQEGRKVIDDLTSFIDESLLSESGSVFYSGRAAFSARAPLYILGLNPGGSPQLQGSDTVKIHTRTVLEGNAKWSAYADEEWREGYGPGTSGMQPRVLHLVNQLGFDPRTTPASNVVFVRSARERDLRSRFDNVASLCWPFHQQVIERLHVRVVLCFGKLAGSWVCRQLRATTYVDQLVEKNARQWRSLAYKADNGITVIVATHPSRADWTNPTTDPTELVRSMLPS